MPRHPIVHPIANSVRHKLIVNNKKNNLKIDSHLYGMDSTTFTNESNRLNSTASSPPANIDNLSSKQRNNLNTDADANAAAIDFEALRSSILRSVYEKFTSCIEKKSCFLNRFNL